MRRLAGKVEWEGVFTNVIHEWYVGKGLELEAAMIVASTCKSTSSAVNNSKRKLESRFTVSSGDVELPYNTRWPACSMDTIGPS